MRKIALSIYMIFSFTLIFAQTPVLLKDINPGYPDVGFFHNNQSEIYLAGDKFYFKGNYNSDGYNYQVFMSDGTPNGTNLLFEQEDFATNPEKFMQAGNLVFFVADAPFNQDELWATDGTANGTHLVKDINPDGFSRPFGLMAYQDKLYFWANDGTHGDELWTSDGTESGTYMVKDINTVPGIGSINEYDRERSLPVIYDDLIYFNAGENSSTTNLWRTNGTSAGTQKFHDSRGISALTVFEDKLYFSSTGLTGQNNSSGLWVTDGTSEGTSLVRYFNGGVQDLFVCNGKLYFYGAYTGLWVTDGTPVGTQLVKNINPSGQSYWYPQTRPGLGPTMAEFNGKLYFTAVQSDYGAEMWMTDGTPEGTEMLMDIDEDNQVGSTADYSGPYNLTVLDGKLFFSTSNDEYGQQLWVTEGTAETTNMIIPENPKYNALSFTDKLIVLNGRLYFPANYNDQDYASIYYLGENMEINEVLDSSKLSFYPNPVNDWLYLSENMHTIEIYTLQGELILKLNNQKDLNLSHLKKGIYLLKAKDADGDILTSKIIKN